MFALNNAVESAEQLNESGCFPNRQSIAQFLILDELAQRDTPLGSMKLKMALVAKGCNISEANIGRYLAYLDAQGYTEVQKTQGRYLTCEGRAYVSAKKQEILERNLQNNYLKSLKVETLDDLISLLELRRLLECYAASLVVVHATEEDAKKIRKNLSDHRCAVMTKTSVNTLALDYHRLLAHAAHNKMIDALLGILIDSEAVLEAKERTLVTREKGSEYQVDHERLYEDIFILRDGEKAKRDMYDHITVLINGIMETKEKTR